MLTEFQERVNFAIIETYLSTDQMKQLDYDETYAKNSFDISKSYSTAVLFSQMNYNQFSTLDEIQPYDERGFNQGFFFLSEPFKHESGFTIAS